MYKKSKCRFGLCLQRALKNPHPFRTLSAKHLILIKALMPTERRVKTEYEKTTFDRVVIQKKENHHRVRAKIVILFVLISPENIPSK